MKALSILQVCLVAIVLAGHAFPSAVRAQSAARAQEVGCEAPAIEVADKPGGQHEFKIRSPCRKGELVIGHYGEVGIMERLDMNGDVTFQLDCFLGDQTVSLIFADNQQVTNNVCAAAENTLTKVAIVWQDRVDVDLHAFEYAALPDTTGDRSARNRGSYEEAQSEYSESGRSSGFMSMVSDGQNLGHNVEVYTLLRHPEERRGVIAMALSLGDGHGGCGDRRTPLHVDLDVYVFDRGNRLRTYGRTLTAACDGTGPRFADRLIPNIVLGTLGGAAHVP